MEIEVMSKRIETLEESVTKLTKLAETLLNNNGAQPISVPAPTTEDEMRFLVRFREKMAERNKDDSLMKQFNKAAEEATMEIALDTLADLVDKKRFSARTYRQGRNALRNLGMFKSDVEFRELL